MNFTFNVNHFLKEEITKIDNRLQPCRQNGSNRYGFQSLQRMLYEVVDKMGEASAKAQNLPGSITTGKRLETVNQRLYIMKDASSGDQPSVVGILKVGTKKLFVYDPSKIQHELDPLCVLDFYVHESRQREGCGRKLFEFMLRSEGIRVEHLAIDRPSPKLMAFLKKHYNLHVVIPQVNNFVIFDGFFDGRGGANGRKKAGADYHKVNNSSWNPLRPPSGKRSATPLEQIQRQGREIDNISSKLPNTSVNQPHHLGAGDVMYSRHQSTPPYNRTTPPAPTPPNRYLQGNSQLTANISPSPHVNSNYYFNNNNWNKVTSPHMYFAMGTNPSHLINPSDIASNNPLTHQRTTGVVPHGNEMSAFSKGPASTPNFGARFGRDSDALFPDNNNRARSTTIQGERLLDTKQNSMMLPDIQKGNLKVPSYPSSSGQNPQSETLAHRPPSGKKGFTNAKDNMSNPPLLQREGPPQEYKMMMATTTINNNNSGHPVTNATAASPFETSVSPQQPASVMSTNGYHATAAKPPYAAISSTYSYSPQRDTSWTVSGVLRERRLNANVNSWYNPRRLW